MKLSNIVKELLTEAKVISFPHSFGNFIVVTGGPGSGKGMVTSNLLNLRDYKYFNVDTYREMLAKKLNLDLKDPEHNKRLHKVARSTSNPKNVTIKSLRSFLENDVLVHKMATGNMANIVFDTTGSEVGIIDELKSAAERKGFKTTLIHVATDVEIALARNDMRTRTLDSDLVKSYHKRVADNLPELVTSFDDVWIVTNNEVWDAFKGREEFIDVDGKKFVVKREGEFLRPTDRIKKIK